MESKEKWIEKVMDTSTSIETVQHQPFLYQKTLNTLKEEKTASRDFKWAAPILTSVVFLVFLNSFMIFNYQGVDEIAAFEDSEIISIIEEYALNQEIISLYEL